MGKREETPLQEEYLQPLACGAQARLGLEDVTADDLAGYLEDTTFFPKRMSCMAEMMSPDDPRSLLEIHKPAPDKSERLIREIRSREWNFHYLKPTLHSDPRHQSLAHH